MKVIEFDISKLPLKAQKELFEFYSFLRYKYVDKNEIEKSQHVKKERKKGFEYFLKDTLTIHDFVMPNRNERNER